MKIFKKMSFRWPKRWNLAENDKSPMESFSLTHFQLKSSTNMCKSKVWPKKTDGIGRKMMNLLRSPTR